MEKDEAAVYRSSDRMDERNEQKQRLQAAFMQRFNSLMEGMSCQGMAERLGVSAAVVWHYSRGSRFPDVTALANIADCLHVTMDWLVGRDAQGVSGVTDDTSQEAGLSAMQEAKNKPKMHEDPIASTIKLMPA